MTPLQCDDPVTAVLMGVPLRSQPEQTAVEQPECGCCGSVPGLVTAAKVMGGLAAGSGESGGKRENMVEFLTVSSLAPRRMVEILDATGIIDACRL